MLTKSLYDETHRITNKQSINHKIIKMKKIIIMLTLLFTVSTVFVGCREKKSADEKIEEAINEIEDDIDEASDDVKDAMEDVKDELKEAAEESKKKGDSTDNK